MRWARPTGRTWNAPSTAQRGTPGGEQVSAVQKFETKDLVAYIYDTQKIFEVDNVIKKLAAYNNGARVQQRWHNNEANMLAFTRRTLEVASWEAMAAIGHFKTEVIQV
jgi:Ni/Co efflux regulator RcnB